MDVQLIEKITRMVIAKLHEVHHQSSINNGLSQQELQEWERISSKVNVFKDHSNKDTPENSLQLTQTEIEEWEKISLQIKQQYPKSASFSYMNPSQSSLISFRPYN